jgi:DNA end-binding protein Ku
VATIVRQTAFTFGLVIVPVALTRAVANRRISFRNLHRECGSPLRAGRICPEM